LKQWAGYIELNYDKGVKRCEIVPQGDGEEPGVWIDGDLADDIEGRDDLVRSYGSRFFDSMADFKAGRALSIDDVWPAASGGN